MKTIVMAVIGFLGIGEGWQRTLKWDATHNGKKAQLIRYSKKTNQHLHGEHLSFLLDANNRLLGFVRMEANHKGDGLPNESEAKKIALVFLQQFAPDLIENMKILWVDKHDEFLHVDGKKLLVQGTKVKCQDTKSGLYFWTIIDGNDNVFVFEREIKWITFPGKRGTEKFLHDDWLSQNFKDQLP